jgi:outer membrane protein assembly factor BamB
MKAALLVALFGCGDNLAPRPDPHCDAWRQWAHDASHTGSTCASGQALQRVLADIVLDPFAEDEEKDSGGDLVIHYQVPLVDGDAVFVEQKRGRYLSCNTNPTDPICLYQPSYRLNTQVWNETRYDWQGDTLVQTWSQDSDWKPPPGVYFEPMFQPALTDKIIAMPGDDGSVIELDAATGTPLRRDQPDGFGSNHYVAGAITERYGYLYYNAVELDYFAPTLAPSKAWLVAVAPDGKIQTASYGDLVPGAPSPDDDCFVGYGAATIMIDGFPPLQSNGKPYRPPTRQCGRQLPGINSAPTFARDGSMYVVTHAQYDTDYSYLVSVDPGDLSANWVRSLRGLLHDGCGITEECQDGAPQGIDGYTGQLPAATVDDDSSSNPVVMADGTILYGSLTGYNGDRGHLLAFSHDGEFRASYGFGWDTTPAVVGDRIVLKDNTYFDPINPMAEPGPYNITMLDRSLQPSWQFQNTETKSCTRNANGTVKCVVDHPNGFEWCVNAPAIDRDGTIFANSEDGNMYAIAADGTLRDRFFLNRSLGAAYTPVAIDASGRIYALNNGHLFVVGE